MLVINQKYEVLRCSIQTDRQTTSNLFWLVTHLQQFVSNDNDTSYLRLQMAKINFRELLMPAVKKISHATVVTLAMGSSANSVDLPSLVLR